MLVFWCIKYHEDIREGDLWSAFDNTRDDNDVLRARLYGEQRHIITASLEQNGIMRPIHASMKKAIAMNDWLHTMFFFTMALDVEVMLAIGFPINYKWSIFFQCIINNLININNLIKD